MSQTVTRPPRTLSPGRTALVALASAVTYLVGFYVGFFVLLSIVSLEGFEGWQFPLVTVPAGALLAGAAASLTSPDPGRVWWPVGITTVLAGFAWVLVVYAIDGGFEASLIAGGIVCVVAATAAAVVAHRARSLD